MVSEEAKLLPFAAQLQLPLGPKWEQLELEVGAQDSLQRSVDADPNCLFCRPSDAAINTILMRKRHMYARLDNFPASPGHVELVPFRHVDSFFDLTTEESQDLVQLSKRIRAYLDHRFQPDAYTIGVNDGSAAGRTVPHLHLHIIPRWFGDVPDPRGGIRQVFPNDSVDAWLK